MVAHRGGGAGDNLLTTGGVTEITPAQMLCTSCGRSCAPHPRRVAKNALFGVSQTRCAHCLSTGRGQSGTGPNERKRHPPGAFRVDGASAIGTLVKSPRGGHVTRFALRMSLAGGNADTGFAARGAPSSSRRVRKLPAYSETSELLAGGNAGSPRSCRTSQSPWGSAPATDTAGHGEAASAASSVRSLVPATNTRGRALRNRVSGE
jgi:hypothetical protein